MKIRLESYLNLYHGTDAESASQICANGFIPSKGANNWCGDGVYFYDINAKAWWSANRTCDTIKEFSDKKVYPCVVIADVLNVPRQEILDLRAKRDLIAFEEGTKGLFGDHLLQCDGTENEAERIRTLRSLMISFYAEKAKKSVVVGIFQQRERDDYQTAIQFAEKLQLIAGVETIYCVKDTSYIQNIRMGGT